VTSVQVVNTNQASSTFLFFASESVERSTEFSAGTGAMLGLRSDSKCFKVGGSLIMVNKNRIL